MSDKTHTNGGGESYSAIVPAKRSNESQGGPQEIVEGRALTEENAERPNPNRTPSREFGSSGLERVREAVRFALPAQKSGPSSEVRTVCVKQQEGTSS